MKKKRIVPEVIHQLIWRIKKDFYDLNQKITKLSKALDEKITAITNDVAQLSNTVTAVDERIIMTTETIAGMGANYLYLPTKAGYSCITAVNPSYASPYYVTGISAWANGTTVIFIDHAMADTGNITLNVFWHKNNQKGTIQLNPEQEKGK